MRRILKTSRRSSKWLLIITGKYTRELIQDHGSGFGAHRTDELGDRDGEFKRYVESFGTKPIRIRVNHPQSNGKIEKWFDVYERHREEFSTFDEFVHWYNCVRPHESLDPKGLKTPEFLGETAGKKEGLRWKMVIGMEYI